jgi:hypothetical protein
MDAGWYIKSESGVKGPFAAAVLKGMAQQGEVVACTLVRHGADGNWVAASHVKGLFGQAEPAIAAPPIQSVSGSNIAELLDEAAEEDTVRKQQQDRMAELLTEAEQEATRKQQQQVPSDSEKSSRLVPCVDCEKPISRLASICPNCGCPVIVPSSPDKYPALRLIAGVNKFFSVVVPILCLIGLAIIGNSRAPSLEAIVPLVIYMIVAPLALWGTAELILLLIRIERNTSTLRGMPQCLEDRRLEEEAKATHKQRNLLEDEE